MEVKFANCYVPIWKLKAGTVIQFEDTYCHIKHVMCFADNTIADIEVESIENIFDTRSDQLTWLEPH